MLSDSEAYEDYRYELRIGAALARAKKGCVLRYAGDAPGPDIEFVAASGETCGVACYRARGETPAIRSMSEKCQSIVAEFGGAFAAHTVGIDIGTEVIFPDSPPTEAQWNDAAGTLKRAWHTSDSSEVVGESGVMVRHCVPLRDLRIAAIRRRARLRFMFPMRSGETFRVERHVLQKLSAEQSSWVGAYNGYSIFAFEASPWTIPPDNQQLNAMLRASGTTFRGALATQISFPASEGCVHGFEDISAYVPGIHIAMCTFGQNSRVWAEGAAGLHYVEDHACEYWDVWQVGETIAFARSKPLGMEKRRTTVALGGWHPGTKLDDDTAGSFADALKGLMHKENPFDW